MTDTMITETIDRQEWLDPVDQALEAAIDHTLEAAGPSRSSLENFLHGVWLGHPLHPWMTDLPIGAWTTALFLDLLEMRNNAFGAGADAAIAIGLAGATLTAATGLADWSQTDQPARRVGVAHGLLNGAVTLLYGASLAARKTGNRTFGKGLSALGFSVLSVSAYLGAHLVYNERVGTNHSQGIELPKDFVPVMDERDLPENRLTPAEANGVPLLLVRRSGSIRALLGVCPHMGGPLSEGALKGDAVQCPWHGSCFSLSDGHVVNGPSAFPVPSLETRVRNGKIEVKAASR
jgi:nitrite reductase/ring-hydroxylating ferredoxin subunit/uncharacterized membrane protein